MNFIDLHTDMPLKLLRSEEPVSNILKGGFEGFAQNAAFWFEGNEKAPILKYNEYLNKTKKYSAKQKAEIISQSGVKNNGYLLSVENAWFLADRLDFVYRLKRDKCFAISLTWNNDNRLAGGAFGSGTLTEKGKDVVKKINLLNIALDISHLNESSANEAAELAKYPIATHSNCKAVFDTERNLSDTVLQKIRDKSGLVGICFYPEFLGDGDVFLNIYKNIEHLLNLGMEKNIAIGSDFDGCKTDERLSNYKDIYFLYEFLLNFGIKEEVLKGIFYKNAIAFFDRMCQNKV